MTVLMVQTAWMQYGLILLRHHQQPKRSRERHLAQQNCSRPLARQTFLRFLLPRKRAILDRWTGQRATRSEPSAGKRGRLRKRGRDRGVLCFWDLTLDTH